MASNKVIQFPNSIAKEDRIRMKEARLEELELENGFLHYENGELNKLEAKYITSFFLAVIYMHNFMNNR